jgi:hypothetical protein
MQLLAAGLQLFMLRGQELAARSQELRKWNWKKCVI